MEDHKLSLYDNIAKVNAVDPELYERYPVKRGLRNSDGSGVIAGVTNISNVHGCLMNEGDKVPDEGKLTFRGYSIYDLVGGDATKRRGFEEIVYLLLMGELPTSSQLDVLVEALDAQRNLPDGFTASKIMSTPSHNIMNLLQRSVLMLYADDPKAEERSFEHEISTAISLISRLPRIMVLAHYAKRAAFYNESMIMHRFIPGQSTSETILSMLRPNREFTPEEARMLDIMMSLHAEHGGGNNSTFTTRVVTSAGSDTYSVIAAALSSLKGPKHGGANIKVVQMMQDLKEHVDDVTDEEQVRAYLRKLVRKEAFDRRGLIYGMGHAVYSISDPRARAFKQFVELLAEEKNHKQEFELYSMIERIAPEVIGEECAIYKGVSANVDFYSGFVYSMLGIPQELFTPIFAMARIVGWSAHRMEELINVDKIIRPAYKSIMVPKVYESLKDRSTLKIDSRQAKELRIPMKGDSC